MRPPGEKVTHETLNKGDAFVYKNGNKKVIATCVSKDDKKREATFKDVDQNHWQEPYDRIPKTVRRILSKLI